MTTGSLGSGELPAAFEVPGHKHLFVLGSFDSRITFYSQQVRALNLVDALLASGRLDGRWRFAIVGAGAAGVTIAAALAATRSDAHVHLYDRQEHLLHLQRGCRRRVLHPHLYDWPNDGSRRARAGLPILDWTAAPASDVARQITSEFHQIASAQGQVEFRKLRTVLAIQRTGHDYRLQHRSDPGGTIDTDSYHAVFVAVGFGPEATTIPAFPPRSYWSDAGVPENPKYAQEVRRTLVSGNGDGGLIDFSASALNDFDHGELVDLVTSFPGSEAVGESILSIDDEASSSATYDIAAMYDARLKPELTSTGLIRDVKHRLRGNTHTTLHTRTDQLFRLDTARLNRILAYLVLKAGVDGAAGVAHKRGHLAPSSEPPVSTVPGHWFNLEGEHLRFDEVLLRHGPDPGKAFEGLEDIRVAYEAAHLSWLREDPARQRQPSLTTGASRRFATTTVPRRERVEPSRCPVPNCSDPVAETIELADGKGTLSICSNHARLHHDGKVPMDLLKTIHAWISGPPAAYEEIRSRSELLKYLVEQTKRSCGINLRINYAGPLFLHPEWYHERRDELEYPAPNLERELFSLLKRRNHSSYSDVKIIFRNVPRYFAKVDRLVAPNERQRLVEDMLQRADEVWPESGTHGPDLLCTETGFHRHPFIFSRSMVDVIRNKPDLPTRSGIVQHDEQYVSVQRKLFDDLYESCGVDRHSEFNKLLDFIKSVAKTR